MPLFLIALGLSLVGGFGGLLVASSVLLINDSTRSKVIPWLVSYAVGALLGVSMLALLPTTMEQLPATRVFPTLLCGILIFFVLAVALVGLYLAIYTLATLHNEFALIRENVISAATALPSTCREGR